MYVKPKVAVQQCHNVTQANHRIEFIANEADRTEQEQCSSAVLGPSQGSQFLWNSQFSWLIIMTHIPLLGQIWWVRSLGRRLHDMPCVCAFALA